MRISTVITLALTALILIGNAQAAITSLGVVDLAPVRPAGYVANSGFGLAFVPGGTDSIAYDTLIVSYQAKDALNNTNTVLERIGFSGGTASLVCSATIPYSFAFGDGTKTFGTKAVQDLTFDPVKKKIVGSFNHDGNNWNWRLFSLDLFSTDTTVNSIAYSAVQGDNPTGNFGAVWMNPATGKYQTTSQQSGTRWISVDPSAMATSGAGGAISKTTVANSNYTAGWYPVANGNPASTSPFLDTEGAAGYQDNSILFLRSFKPTGLAYETHLYQVSSMLDAAAINNYVDLGNAEALDSSVGGMGAYAMASDTAGQRAFIRYGAINYNAQTSKVQILSVVPEPATLALLALGGLLIRRRPQTIAL